jgi:hypothetical protein
MTTSIATLSKNSTNVDIAAAFGEQLNDGSTRVFAVAPSENNASRVTLFMCQHVTTQTNASDAQKFFLGWGQGTRILRAIFSADKAMVNQNGIKAGSVVPFDILVQEKTEPAYAKQQPKINPSTGEVITSEGMPVYEHSSLVQVGEGGKIVTLPRETATVSSDFPGANLIS